MVSDSVAPNPGAVVTDFVVPNPGAVASDSVVPYTHPHQDVVSCLR